MNNQKKKKFFSNAIPLGRFFAIRWIHNTLLFLFPRHSQSVDNNKQGKNQFVFWIGIKINKKKNQTDFYIYFANHRWRFVSVSLWWQIKQYRRANIDMCDTKSEMLLIGFLFFFFSFSVFFQSSMRTVEPLAVTHTHTQQQQQQ